MSGVEEAGEGSPLGEYTAGAVEWHARTRGNGNDERFNTEKTEERRSTQRKKERSFGRFEAKAPASG